MGSVESNVRSLSVKQSNGRISNLVADFLRRKLTVPEIYLKPRIPGVNGVDVIAVDHAGSGDVHGVKVLDGPTAPSGSDVSSLIALTTVLPLHFKYVAVPSKLDNESDLLTAFRGARSFDDSGIGRVGLIYYTSDLNDAELTTDAEAVKLIVKPERFLLRGENLASVEKYLSNEKPDIRVRL